MYATIQNTVGNISGKLKPWHWAPLAMVTIVLSSLPLDTWYSQSQLSLPFFVGRTTFNVVELQSYYAVLVDKVMLNTAADGQCNFAYTATLFAALSALAIAMYVIRLRRKYSALSR